MPVESATVIDSSEAIPATSIVVKIKSSLLQQLAAVGPIK